MLKFQPCPLFRSCAARKLLQYMAKRDRGLTTGSKPDGRPLIRFLRLFRARRPMPHGRGRGLGRSAPVPPPDVSRRGHLRWWRLRRRQRWTEDEHGSARRGTATMLLPLWADPGRTTARRAPDDRSVFRGLRCCWVVLVWPEIVDALRRLGSQALATNWLPSHPKQGALGTPTILGWRLGSERHHVVLVRLRCSW
jgi:hypothetical protein